MINNYTPVPIKTTHSNMLNASHVQNNSPIFVTNQDFDKSTVSDHEPAEHEEDDNTSFE